MHNNIFRMLSILIAFTNALNALNRFKNNRKICNQRIETFNGSGDRIWFEYKYEFLNDRGSNLKNCSQSNVHIYNSNRKSLALMQNEKSASINSSINVENFKRDLIFRNTGYDINSITHILPLATSKYTLVYKPEKLALTKDIFIITFNGRLWLLFACVLVICVLLFRISTKYYHILFRDHALWSWVDITFWVIAASCQQGVSYSPHKFASCLIFLLVYVLAYLLYTVFAATITSTLLQETSTGFIRDITNIQFVSLNITSDLDEIEPYMYSEKVATLNEMFALLDNKYTVGVIPKILFYQHFTQLSDDYRLYKIKDLPLRPVKASLVLKAGNGNTVSKERIATLLQSGVLKRKFNDLYSINVYETETRYYKANFKHIRSSVLLFYGGVAISLLILIVELIVTYCKQPD